MNADKALTEAYENWRGLAETEGEAIGKQDWNLVSACQNALAELQTQIVQLTENARSEWKRQGTEGAAREKSVRAIISEVIEIERRNSTLLNAVREAAQTQLGKLDAASRKLKRVQQSYAPARPAAWTSFS
jgi:hypothetical protein